MDDFFDGVDGSSSTTFEADGNPCHILCGPVIGLVDQTTARVLLEVDSNSDLTLELWAGGEAKASVQQLFKGRKPLAVTFDGLTADTAYELRITGIEGEDLDKVYGKVTTLPETLTSLSIAVVSCNKSAQLPDKDAPTLWESLAERVAATGANRIHYVFHVGDQVYMDPLFESARALFQAGDIAAVRESFQSLYREQWTFHGTRDVLANCANLMIWDDHELRDDFGVRPEDSDPSSEDYKIGEIAREVYWLYQRQLYDDYMHQPYRDRLAELACEYHSHSWGPFGAIFLDQRSGRSFSKAVGLAGDAVYLGDNQWSMLERDLQGGDDSHLAGVNHLIIATSVPLIFLNEDLTTALAQRPSFDDLKDHWGYAKHTDEQLRLLDLMHAWYSAGEGRTVSVVAGDVHVGGYTKIEDSDGVRWADQLVASSITNEVNAQIVFDILEGFFAKQPEGEYEFTHRDFTRFNNYGVVTVAASGGRPDHSLVISDEEGGGPCPCCSTM